MNNKELILAEMSGLFKSRQESIRKFVAAALSNKDALAVLDFFISQIQAKDIESFKGSDAATSTAFELTRAFQAELFALKIIDEYVKDGGAK